MLTDERYVTMTLGSYQYSRTNNRCDIIVIPPHNILLTSGGRGWLKKMPSGNVKRLWDPKSFSHPPGWFWYKRRVSKGPKMHKKDTEVLFRNLSLFYIKRILI